MSFSSLRVLRVLRGQTAGFQRFSAGFRRSAPAAAVSGDSGEIGCVWLGLPGNFIAIILLGFLPCRPGLKILYHEGHEGHEEMDFDDLSHQVIGCALEVHKLLGPGLLESTYEQCLAHELTMNGILFKIQQPLPVIYKVSSS